MDFLSIFQKMLELFLVILAGYVANKCKVMDEAASRVVSKLVVNVTMPFFILSSVTGSDSLPSAGAIAGILAVAFASSFALLALGALVPRFLHLPKLQRGVYSFMLAFGNVGFIGFPAVAAIFGRNAVFYASIFNMPFNILLYTAGISFLAGGEQGKMKLKNLMTPCLIASVLALIIAFIKPPVPSIVDNTFALIGQVTTPGALLVIGSMLATMAPREMLGGWRLYVVAAVRLLAYPLLLWLCLRLFITDKILLGVAVILAGMPVATNGTMLCLEYGADSKSMTQATFITTVCSVLTISMLAMLVG